MKEQYEFPPEFIWGASTAAHQIEGNNVASTDLATAGSVYLVSLDDSHVQSLLSASPYYTAATIKAGTY